MLTRWNDKGFGSIERDLAAFDELRREMNRMFAELDRGFGTPRRNLLGAATWPRVDLLDNGDALVLRAEVPGMSQKDLDISVDQGTLTIRGERSDEVPEGYSVHRKERASYRFARSFTLPCQCEVDNADASLKDGILTLTMPKVPEARPKQITVKTEDE